MPVSFSFKLMYSVIIAAAVPGALFVLGELSSAGSLSSLPPTSTFPSTHQRFPSSSQEWHLSVQNVSSLEVQCLEDAAGVTVVEGAGRPQEGWTAEQGALRLGCLAGGRRGLETSHLGCGLRAAGMSRRALLLDAIGVVIKQIF